MRKRVSQKAIHRMMDRAVAINKSCPEECRDFTVMTSPMRKRVLLLRWTTINIDNIDNPVQCYHYECFDLDGAPQHCSVNYADQEEANEFFRSLEAHCTQTYATDHRHGRSDSLARPPAKLE